MPTATATKVPIRNEQTLNGKTISSRLSRSYGLQDSVKTDNVFKNSALSWTKRAIIKNAIRTLRPHPPHAGSSFPAGDVSDGTKLLRVIGDGHLEVDRVLALQDLARFVFVMTVLERYSEGCSSGEIRAARVRALAEVADLTCPESCCEFRPGTTLQSAPEHVHWLTR